MQEKTRSAIKKSSFCPWPAAGLGLDVMFVFVQRLGAVHDFVEHGPDAARMDTTVISGITCGSFWAGGAE
jgi:hypothetical protein